MQNAIKQKIKQLCARAIDRAHKKLAKEQEYARKYEKRTGHKSIAKTSSKAPVHRHFDPLYCKRNANFLAKTIWHKVIRY
jgi:RNA-directed DNA polymerase